MLNISHTINVDQPDFNTWIADIYNRPKQEDYSISVLNKNIKVSCKKSLGFFYFKAYHNIYKSLIQTLIKK